MSGWLLALGPFTFIAPRLLRYGGRPKFNGYSDRRLSRLLLSPAAAADDTEAVIGNKVAKSKAKRDVFKLMVAPGVAATTASMADQQCTQNRL